MTSPSEETYVESETKEGVESIPHSPTLEERINLITPTALKPFQDESGDCCRFELKIGLSNL